MVRFQGIIESIVFMEIVLTSLTVFLNVVWDQEQKSLFAVDLCNLLKCQFYEICIVSPYYGIEPENLYHIKAVFCGKWLMQQEQCFPHVH